MRLSAEKHHLLQKGLKAAVKPGETILGALVGTLTFGVVYACNCLSVRHTSPGVSTVGIVSCLATTLIAGTVALTRYQTRRPARSWIAGAVIMAICFSMGYSMGNSYWWKTMVNYYTWPEMASYVNIDPDMDRGQSYMDAGTVYFKEGSYVLRNHTVPFRNGLTYCVAPIVRQPMRYEPGSQALPTVNGFVLPRSGTVDFWAVGTDCCGADGGTFDCADVNSLAARSGLRILDETSRSMYLLGVQEWSATTGLPVRHPLFFSWVKDPIMFEEGLAAQCSSDFVIRVTTCLFLSFILSYFLHAALQKVHVN
uniref:Uncharacterized protein n=1 Tax=Zooxanthella nutricula TaxID=1333877 RepID=A0A6V0G1Z0_9DINO|mmetsp:Transcript_15214/g.45034  ORF Transcript_15214/g.45034 Transcript_15214/m.45034 type:complete len:310 (+) Transcript_15214:73-1002(+)|eukprot:CAMPEP_0198511076 /NCGR_PEP_ID=MMETSP1462-20131121/14579_1 /TAXON_ID=1333877 /ORGANISM="Brandtodinium nutriculum, Strain RCC3387" /LENGTH=309 /DNA_ID=CAMNT_0044240431 /DNA_START=60 /DNA_END=989 /DNA_ORIENTATION=-